MDHPIPAAIGHDVQRIRGAIGARALSKPPELFRQDLKIVAQELLQNARRAGARSIAVEHLRGPDGGSLTIRDDGRGVTDFQVLLTFGESQWDERLCAVEAAAGMGFFSVASRGALVRSRGQRVSLDTAVFRRRGRGLRAQRSHRARGHRDHLPARDGERAGRAHRGRGGALPPAQGDTRRQARGAGGLPGAC